ncbi:MAG: hypothetical protein ACLU0O_06775 [Collinsella sp.]
MTPATRIGDAEAAVKAFSQINLIELPVELGVMVACPGKERLVKVGTRGRDAKDAGNFDATNSSAGSLLMAVRANGDEGSSNR